MVVAGRADAFGEDIYEKLKGSVCKIVSHEGALGVGFVVAIGRAVLLAEVFIERAGRVKRWQLVRSGFQQQGPGT